MTHFSIKDVPEATAGRLRERAARNHRSLQGELLAIIEAAANDNAISQTALQQRRETHTTERPQRATKSVEQIAAELRALFPQPVTGGQRSVDIVRELRDSR